MSIIKAFQLTKEFKLHKRQPGLSGMLHSLFYRRYETKEAVSNISFEIEKGEMIGYIGPNGAGKSTTIKMLVGILVPTSGQVEVRGIVPYKHRIENARHIGVVFGQRTQLWWDIPVSESFNLMRYMYDIPKPDYTANLTLFADILGIDEFLHVPVRQLSLGQRMRADLCYALLHSPDILFLDEPTIGLDVEVKDKIREFLSVINQQHATTVILTTHDMSDIERLCSRIMVIDHGRMMYDGTLQKLKEDYGADETLVVDTREEIANADELCALGVEKIEQKGNRLVVKYDRRVTKSAQILGRLMQQSGVTDFTVRETGVEEIILRLYKVIATQNQAALK